MGERHVIVKIFQILSRISIKLACHCLNDALLSLHISSLHVRWASAEGT